MEERQILQLGPSRAEHNVAILKGDTFLTMYGRVDCLYDCLNHTRLNQCVAEPCTNLLQSLALHGGTLYDGSAGHVAVKRLIGHIRLQPSPVASSRARRHRVASPRSPPRALAELHCGADMKRHSSQIR